ncbi:MAG: hypothetical protein ABIS50_26985 [Luteolibacter sp.]|uniref:hypothetical protein n=1 Tax=Luteolibacter sp. TaxID=1962973 RepID=UPI00326720B2
MKSSGKCPKCSSSDIIADAKALDRSPYESSQEFTLATFSNPKAAFFKGQQTTPVSAWVCGDCGFVELYADYAINLKQK